MQPIESNPANETGSPESISPTIGLGTLAAFLIGRRAAILQIVRSRGVLVVGAMFVLSAGLAREYDGQDLLHEPKYLLLPFAASIATSAGIYLLLWQIVLRRATPRIAFLPGYFGFLSLYWMTAPLAWLYAVPWERIVLPYSALLENVTTLAIVSAWRVILLIRCVGVLCAGDYIRPAIVILFASCIAIIVGALATAPAPLFVIMGGLRLTPAELMQVELHESTISLTLIAALPLGFATFLMLVIPSAKWPRADLSERPNPRITRILYWLGAMSIAGWIPILLITQPEQLRRSAVEQAFADRDLTHAFELLRQTPQSGFPPGWRPPPKITSQGIDRDLTYEVMDRVQNEELPEWVREYYRELWQRCRSDPMFRRW